MKRRKKPQKLNIIAMFISWIKFVILPMLPLLLSFIIAIMASENESLYQILKDVIRNEKVLTICATLLFSLIFAVIKTTSTNKEIKDMIFVMGFSLGVIFLVFDILISKGIFSNTGRIFWFSSGGIIATFLLWISAYKTRTDL